MDCWQENYCFEALPEALPALTPEPELMVLELLYWFRFRACHTPAIVWRPAIKIFLNSPHNGI